MAHNSDKGDHLHAIGKENGRLTRTYDFDYDAVDRGIGWKETETDTVTFSDMTAAFVLILEWILKGRNLEAAGGRAAALSVYLDPVHSTKFGNNISEIARQSGVTKQALSHALMEFRDSVEVLLTAGKLGSTRSTYREVQYKNIEAGTHSSFNRRDRRSPAKPAQALSPRE